LGSGRGGWVVGPGKEPNGRVEMKVKVEMKGNVEMAGHQLKGKVHHNSYGAPPWPK
jgi:hypothetical protein